MRSVSQEAKRVLDILTNGINSENAYRKVDTSKSFKAVSVDFLGESKLGSFFSVAHNSIQNGDVMADPDMEFLKATDGNYYPIRYQNDFLPGFLGHSKALNIEGGKITSYYPKVLRDLCSFTTKWMRNITQQQDLDTITAAKAA